MNWTDLIAQLPLIAAFIWFARENNKTFYEALAAQEKRFDERNNALVTVIVQHTSQIAELTKSTVSHDSWSRASVALMVTNKEEREELLTRLQNPE